MTEGKESGRRGATWPSPGRPTIEPFERPKLVSVRVADQLRAMIIAGRIRLGDQLSENTLAAQLGVSRTPVREAFMTLEAEKLVEVRPHRGTFVFTCDVDEAREICEHRAILEIGAMRLATQRDRAVLIAALHDVTRRSERPLAMGPEAYQPLDIEFHETIFRGAGNANLTEAYERICGRVSALRWRLTKTLAQIGDSHAQHCEIVDRVASGDDNGADALMRKHVSWIHGEIVSLFEAEQNSVALEAIAGAS